MLAIAGTGGVNKPVGTPLGNAFSPVFWIVFIFMVVIISNHVNFFMRMVFMMDDTEFMALVVRVSTEFKGSADDLVASVGLVTVGRLYGWRVMRLIMPRRTWTVATKLFGNLKDPYLMPERGVLAHKSLGLVIVDKFGDYWGFIRGHRTRDLSTEDRRSVI